MDTGEGLEPLTAQLRRLHAGLESYSSSNKWWPTKAEEWVADLWRYDHVLLSAAERFGLPVPPKPPQDAMRRLSPAERAELERQLAEQGIDLAGVSDPKDVSAGGR